MPTFKGWADRISYKLEKNSVSGGVETCSKKIKHEEGL